MANVESYVLPTTGSLQALQPGKCSSRLASVCSREGQVVVELWEHRSQREGWSLKAKAATLEPVCRLAWSFPEYGDILVGGTGSGRLLVWQQSLQRGCTALEETFVVELPGGKAVTNLTFAPREAGLIVAAGSADGHVYFFEGDKLLQPKDWTLHSKLHLPKACLGGKTFCIANDEQSPCSCLSWRPGCTASSLVLACGSASGVSVWQFCSRDLEWQEVVVLSLSSTRPPTSCSWGLSPGRSVELIAVACHDIVELFSLKNDGEGLTSEQCGELQHEAGVLKVDWNQLGTCLACSSADRSISLWRPDLMGRFQKVAVVAGQD